MLETIKEILNMNSEDKDFLLQYYITKAQGIIKGYCGIGFIPQEYESTIIDYAIYLYKNRNEEGIQQIAQGNRSITYINAIPESIRLALPKPKVKVIG